MRTFPQVLALLIGLVLLAQGGAMAGDAVVIPAEKLRVQGAGKALPDGGWNLWSNAAVGDYFEAAQEGEIEVAVQAAGQPCQGVFPLAQWSLRTDTEQREVGEPFTVGTKEFKEYRTKIRVPKGRFTLLLAFLNDAQAGGEDRNLLVKEFSVTGAQRLDRLPDLKDALAEGIRKNRMGTLVVQTAPGATVRVTMKKHEFLFGTAIAHQMWGDRKSVV
jgi:hypothetical protein